MENRSSFENLPDEILLLICGYLSQINILDSLLNLNKRLNKTIAFYRQKIFLSHLSFNEFHHLLNNYLVNLAPNVYHLYINNSSMLNAGKIFEQKFSQIDQQFSLLQELYFHQIDIETLENLSWRFNTMNNLRQLSIDITEDRLLSMPVQFDEFLCGKLFSKSNSFQSLILNLNKYRFNLHSLTQKCENLRHLTISIRQLNDLFILFDHLPNLEQLNITIGCSSSSNLMMSTYSYEQLWWKVAYLTKFHLTIEEKQLTSHDYVLSHEIILKIIENLYSLLDLKFELNIKFNSTLQLITTKEIYMNKYLPYIDGTLWEQALQRNDHRMIAFQLYIELDGFTNHHLKIMRDSNGFFIDKIDGKIIHFLFFKTFCFCFVLDIDFKLLLKRTFSSAYWLQKNTTIQCYTTPSKHVTIYTLPLKISHRSTTVDIIDQEISVKSSPSHVHIQNLTILSNSNSSLNLSMINLFAKFPCLTHLTMDIVLLLPPTRIICSNRLRFLSLTNYSLISCCELLDYFPQVISLSITNSFCERLCIDSCSKSSRSITRLKLIIDSFYTSNLSNIKQYFPNLKEFYLIIKSIVYGSLDDFRQFEKFEGLSDGFTHLRYMEISLPIKSGLLFIPESDRIRRIKTSDGHYLISKKWLEK